MPVCSCLCGGGQDRHAGPVSLNIGGETFTTSRKTLARCKKLLELTSQSTGRDGVYFLDRDGRHFGEILNFCRDGPESYVTPTNEDVRRSLRREAVFFELPELADILEEPYCGAPIPRNEELRLQRLDGLNIMHTDEHEDIYENITKMVTAVLDTPIALVSLVHHDHQWFKARTGLQASRTSRKSSFCAFTFTPEDPAFAQMLVIEDAKRDFRTISNPLVIGEPYIGFYAGCPIITSDGIRLGSLCAIDQKPRSISAAQAQTLVNLAQITATEIERDQLASGDDIDEAVLEGVPGRHDFAAGSLRAQRMRESLGEMLLLVRVRLDSTVWPVLWGNRYFSELSGIQLTPAPVLTGRASAAGAGIRYLRDPAATELALFDWLQLTGKGQQQLFSDLEVAWKQTEVSQVAVQAAAPAVARRGVGGGARGGSERMRLDIRFQAVEFPLDVAAAAIRPVPPRDPSDSGSTRLPGMPANERLFFVIGRKLGRAPNQQAHFSSTASTPSSSAAQPLSGSTSSVPHPVSGSSGRGNSLKSVEAIKPPRSPFQDVRLVRTVGQGSFGKVSYALWMGSPVAVKIIESKVSSKSKKFEPIFEAALSTSIMHPNLVQTYKYSTRAKPLEEGMEQGPGEPEMETWMVQEWCDRGTLHTMCQQFKGKPDAAIEILDICLDICRAGSYLHSRGIIHGDLTGNNVLIKTQVSRKGYVCKVADFGLARILEGNNVDIVTTQLGTVTHMPPELFEVTKEVKLTTKADIYAAGMLLFECFAGDSPHAGLTAPQVVVQVMKGRRPKLPEYTPESICEIFDRCSAVNPKDRPTFDELVLLFGGVLSDLQQGNGEALPA